MNATQRRRKAMLGNMLEPVALQTVRLPYDGSTAKSGAVEFRNENDSAMLNLTAEIVNGAIVVTTTSRLPVKLKAN